MTAINQDGKRTVTRLVEAKDMVVNESEVMGTLLDIWIHYFNFDQEQRKNE